MSSAVSFTNGTSTVDELFKFNDLPAEMKDHIFKHLCSRELVISRGICRNWNFIISDSKHFQENITFTVCNDETLRIFRNSYTNWFGMKFTSFDLNSNPGPHQDILPQFINELESRYCNLSNLLLHDLHIQQGTFLRAIVACPNLKSLVFDHVHIMTDNTQAQASDSMFSSEILIKAQRVAENLIVLKLHNIPIHEMLFLYNCVALHTLRLTEFYVQECTCQYIIVNGARNPSVEAGPQLQTFLDNTKTILLNNSSTLKTIDISLEYLAAMFKFYRQIFPALKNLQLHNLYLHLYRPPTDVFDGDSYFWLDYTSFNGSENDGIYIPPTQLFTMWKDFIATQRNLRTLYLPHIELSLAPFEETHNHALFELLTSLPTTIKELGASLVQKGINERDVLVYQNLTKLTTSVDLLEYSFLVERNDPTLMLVENMFERPNPKSPNLEDLTMKFLPGGYSRISETTGIRISKILIKICPINLKRLVIKGSLWNEDGTLQVIIEYLPLLEVLDWWCTSLTDHGVTGISPSWLMNKVENVSELSNLINSEKEDEQPKFVGQPLSKLRYLEVLKVPYLFKLSDIGIYYGLRLPRLKKLYLSRNKPYDKITDWGLQQLAINCPLLETIQICVGELTTAEGVQCSIGSMKRINHLSSILKRVVRSEHTVQ